MDRSGNLRRVDVFLDDGDVRVLAGDCIQVMAGMDAGSVDAVVCDPPYALEFMGRGWDKFTPAGFQAWCEEWGTQALRVLRPGGHLLAFGGTRTFHRLTAGLEDAGFEIRDCLSWLYGSGFPKSLDVSKAIDKAAGAEREVIGTIPDRWTGKGNALNFATDRPQDTVTVTGAPATDAAREWEGWGTALKPAWEPIVLARKPIQGTVAHNVQQHRTGALNIDGCRIVTEEDTTRPHGYFGGGVAMEGGTCAGGTGGGHAAGRWPANVVLDEAAAQTLDAQTGELHYQDPATRASKSTATGVTAFTTRVGSPEYGDRGGPSRFYYTAKASRRERTAGGRVENTHPTVKPVELMRWLVRLVCPPGGVVLDPFAGSGTTGVACRAEGVRCVLVEREAEYLPIIAGRLTELSLGV